jgi:hypothetical protein
MWKLTIKIYLIGKIDHGVKTDILLFGMSGKRVKQYFVNKLPRIVPKSTAILIHINSLNVKYNAM